MAELEYHGRCGLLDSANPRSNFQLHDRLRWSEDIGSEASVIKGLIPELLPYRSGWLNTRNRDSTRLETVSRHPNTLTMQTQPNI